MTARIVLTIALIIADGSQAGVLIAHRSNPVALSTLPRLAAHLASAKRFQLSGFDAPPYGVRPVIYVDTKRAEFLFGLQDFERASGRFLGFRNSLQTNCDAESRFSKFNELRPLGKQPF
jgi:hypothetical protein